MYNFTCGKLSIPVTFIKPPHYIVNDDIFKKIFSLKKRNSVFAKGIAQELFLLIHIETIYHGFNKVLYLPSQTDFFKHSLKNT